MELDVPYQIIAYNIGNCESGWVQLAIAKMCENLMRQVVYHFTSFSYVLPLIMKEM